ncbi:hypothetical protein AB0I82_35235 [Streptomyces sp. NPDC050315]|uniref:hypothetical protein n=1 Tax=Streptomyces sp. NPDC050315 TaxID=3155039 RepID=UPI0034207C81
MEHDDEQDWIEIEAGIRAPWPELDDYLHLRPGHLIGIGAVRGSREAEAGYDLALHTAAQGRRTLLCAPDLSPRSPVPNLDIHRQVPHPEALAALLDAATPHPFELVVVDHFGVIQTAADEGPIHHPEQAADIVRDLKRLAMRRPAPTTLVVMAHLAAGTDNGMDPLKISALGLAAELEYDADTLLLLKRTGPHNVDILVAKDRYSPSPRKGSVCW